LRIIVEQTFGEIDNVSFKWTSLSFSWDLFSIYRRSKNGFMLLFSLKYFKCHSV